MRYIAIPCGTGRRSSPRIFAIEKVIEDGEADKYYATGLIGLPPYYKVTGLNGGEPTLQVLNPGSDEFRYVQKWVGPNETQGGLSVGYAIINTRRILNQPKASANVSKEDVVRMLST